MNSNSSNSHFPDLASMRPVVGGNLAAPKSRAAELIEGDHHQPASRSSLAETNTPAVASASADQAGRAELSTPALAGPGPDVPGLHEPGLLHANAAPARLHFYVKYFFMIWFFRYLFDPLPLLSQLPIGYAEPIGWMRLVPQAAAVWLQSYGGLLLLKYGFLTCCLATLFRRTRLPAALLGCVGLTSINAIVRSFGHINHAELGPLLVTWVLSLFLVRIGGEWSSTQRDSKHRWWHRPHPTATIGLCTAATVMGLAYASVGIARLVDGGPVLFWGDTISNHVVRASSSEWVVGYNFSSWIVDQPVLANLLRAGTLAVTFVEVLVPFAVFSRRIRWLVLAVMPGFHIGAMLLFKVFFVEQILALFLLVEIEALRALVWRWKTVRGLMPGRVS